MPSQNARNISWGRSVENQALRVLRLAWPTMARVGSVGYIKDHADLVASPSEGDTLCLLVTKEKGPGNPLLVTLDLRDFVGLLNQRQYPVGCVVQVKGRQSIWTNGVYKGLVTWWRRGRT